MSLCNFLCFSKMFAFFNFIGIFLTDKTTILTREYIHYVLNLGSFYVHPTSNSSQNKKTSVSNAKKTCHHHRSVAYLCKALVIKTTHPHTQTVITQAQTFTIKQPFVTLKCHYFTSFRVTSLVQQSIHKLPHSSIF